jgi:hypothetical protein
VIIELTMSAHSCALQKRVEMSEQQVDDIVSETRALGISTGNLGRKEWSTGANNPLSEPVAQRLSD